MAAMVAELGPHYLGFALDVLESALPDRGYMGHIRGYTLHYLLEGLSKVSHPVVSPLLCCSKFISPLIFRYLVRGELTRIGSRQCTDKSLHTDVRNALQLARLCYSEQS